MKISPPIEIRRCITERFLGSLYSEFGIEGFAIAETTKLSVGQALEKLRGTEAPKSRMTRLNEKINALDKETQRLRAARRRIERDQRDSSTKRD